MILIIKKKYFLIIKFLDKYYVIWNKKILIRIRVVINESSKR